MVAAWAAIAMVLLSLAWLALAVRVFAFRAKPGAFSRDEWALLAATLLLGAFWTMLAPPWNVGTSAKRDSNVTFTTGCMGLREGMNEARVKAAIKTAPRVVSEEDVRGPGAVAWVYDEQRCVVHLIGGKVAVLEQDSR